MTQSSNSRIRITCNCRVCDGLAAEIGAGGQIEQLTYGDTRNARTIRHNLVRVAHSPFALMESARRNGPWPVD